MSGFTGVEWTSRSAERLAADLNRGAGVSPLVEAGLSWNGVAAECAAIADELRVVIDRIELGWDGSAAAPMLACGREFGAWLHDAGEFAGSMSRLLQAQAAARAVATLAMPNAAEISATTALRDSIATVGGAIGGALLGAGAAADRALVDQHHRAARAMQGYESASGHLAAPPSAPQPPARPAGPAASATPPETPSAPTAPGGIGDVPATSPVAPVMPVMPVAARVSYAVTAPAAMVSRAPSEMPSAASESARAAVPVPPVSAVGMAGDRHTSAARIGATASETGDTEDADLALWTRSAVAPTSWESIDTEVGCERRLRLPDPAVATVT